MTEHSAAARTTSPPSPPARRATAPTRRALDGADPDLPVLLLAHQLEFTDRAAAAGIDLHLSGHARDGRIWPSCHRARLDQAALADLSTTVPAASSAPRPACPPGAVHRPKDRGMRRSPG